MKEEPRFPEIGDYVRHHGRLVSTEIIPPPPQPPPQKNYIFEEIEAECELRLNGEKMIEIQTLSDFYGLETSVKSAMVEMHDYACKKNIGPEHDLEVVVVRVARQYRCRPTGDENFYDKKFFGFKRLDYGARHNVPDTVRTVVWSSRGKLPVVLED